jgi:hypothetical protein
VRHRNGLRDSGRRARAGSSAGKVTARCMAMDMVTDDRGEVRTRGVPASSVSALANGLRLNHQRPNFKLEHVQERKEGDRMSMATARSISRR